ncbi:MAG: hypothetical protein AMQ22_00016 [Candidatus Methanofastidiosum methylothiophilum]|uniref:Uncharacterized protein n=1 Tax=Candidatus Methanofastidiosum methylothiophilum TaxID=1705564 RepID=A0A150J9A6_9EURY|nr:MAG: hypothetical protein AMQ22_00016 [Candidatus Methanofastidiosum methylthiophilus]
MADFEELIKERRTIEKKAKEKIKLIEKKVLKNTKIGDLIKIRVDTPKSAFVIEYWFYHDSADILMFRTNALFDDYKWVQRLGIKDVFKVLEVEDKLYSRIIELNGNIITRFNELGLFIDE